MMIKEAQEQKVNVILEGTMRRPEVTLNTAKEFNSNGYDIHANIIAVKPQESWLGVHERFERMMSETLMTLDTRKNIAMMWRFRVYLKP